MEHEPEAVALRAASSPDSSVAVVAAVADALERACADGRDALRWFERAARLAPADDSLRLALAGACLARDPSRAAALLTELTARAEIREAWLMLAAARNALGDPAGAAAALTSALRRHAILLGSAALALSIARAAGSVGWCGIGPNGGLLVRPIDPDARPNLSLNGRSIRQWTRRQRASGEIAVKLDGRHLLGSPVMLDAIHRVEGFVQVTAAAIEGWAWHPGDPERNPVIAARPVRGGNAVIVQASALATDAGYAGPLARPRAFRIPLAKLPRGYGPVRVTGTDGRDLLGSPLDPSAEEARCTAAALSLARQLPTRPGTNARRVPRALPPAIPADAPRPAAPIGADGRKRLTDVVIPVYGERATTLACIDSVLGNLPDRMRLIVVDDATTDLTLARALDRLAAAGRIRLIRHRSNRGFPASANAGLVAAAGRDVVLLNSDTLVSPHWLHRLRDAAYSSNDVGTVTPLSNNASILSVPGPAGTNPVPDLAQTHRIAALAYRANAGAVQEIPVGIGFCLYIRRDCLDAVGLLRTDVFAQGYGEENDFCLRAARLGWRHVAALGVFVAHVGQRSFGAAGTALRTRNAEVLNRLHPGYDRLVASYMATDPLAVPRRKIDSLRWRESARTQGLKASAILVTHAEGGGVERRLAQVCEEHRRSGRRAVVLRPARTAAGAQAVLVGDGTEGGYPGLVFALPQELPALVRLLRWGNPVGMEIHHLLGHNPALIRLAHLLDIPYDVHIHDYAWFCPRIVLLGASQNYCGEPDISGCEACVADYGNLLDPAIGPRALRARSEQIFAGANRVLAPSADTASRIRRHFPSRPAPDVARHEVDRSLPALLPTGSGIKTGAQTGPVRVCVVGAIGEAKGYNVLLDCSRDAASRSLPLEFVVVGHTIDDARLIATGRVFVTGEFALHEATALIRAQNAQLALLPSIWPETWCYALSDAWRAGLAVAAFDVGAPAERIRATGRGFLLPLGLPAASVNDALVAAVRTNVHEWTLRAGALPPSFEILRDVTKPSESPHVRSCRPDHQLA